MSPHFRFTSYPPSTPPPPLTPSLHCYIMASSWTPAPSFRKIPRSTAPYPRRVRGYSPCSPTPGGVFQSSPQWYPSRSHSDTRTCMFCSSPSHYIRTCPDAAWYLRQGKIICNHAGKLSLPNGRYPPRVTPRKNLQERIDNY